MDIPAQIDKEVFATNYTSDFILNILRIDFDLPAPILDLGCGKRHLLFDHFDLLGKEVVGIDSEVDATSDARLIRTGWFDFPFHPGAFGTVISNMSLTRDCMATIAADGDFLPYALLYMKVLGSLRAGGYFIYSPSVEPIEERLDRKIYTIDRYKIEPTDEEMAAVFAMTTERTGYDPFHTVHVRKLVDTGRSRL